MVNVRLCEKARLAFFFTSPRHFDLQDQDSNESVLNVSLSHFDVIQVHM